MKTVDFSAAGMSTDVPRPISGASVAVRNTFVPYRFVRDTIRNGGGGTTMGGANGEMSSSGMGGLASVGDGRPRKVHSYVFVYSMFYILNAPLC